MANLIAIQDRIAKLEQQAKVIRSRELESTVKEILSKMNEFGISFKYLKSKSQTGAARSSAATKKATKSAKKGGRGAVAPKFCGPNNELWTGRGLAPRWLKAELERGKSKEDFRIKLDEVRQASTRKDTE